MDCTISNSPSSLKLVIVARNTSNNQTVDLQDIGMIADNELSAILVAYSNATDYGRENEVGNY